MIGGGAAEMTGGSAAAAKTATPYGLAAGSDSLATDPTGCAGEKGAGDRGAGNEGDSGEGGGGVMRRTVAVTAGGGVAARASVAERGE
jgi:hypothetical protein